MEKPRQDPEQPALANGKAPPLENGNLEALLEQAQDHLQLQMLLIEMALLQRARSDFGLIVNAYHFARALPRGLQTRRSGEPFLQHCRRGCAHTGPTAPRQCHRRRRPCSTISSKTPPPPTANWSSTVGFKIARLIDRRHQN